MANIYKAKNDLQDQITAKKRHIVSVWLSYVAFMIIGIILNNKELIGFLVIIPVIVSLRNFNTIHILRVGLEGERQTLNLISELDDAYHIFVNLKLTHEKKTSETDLIIIGPKGIFISEIKNHKGVIKGKEEDKNWFQHKIGRKGKPYVKKFYNPTKQVNTHVYRLSQILKKEKIYSWIEGMVYFVNPGVKIEVDTKRTPVLTLENRLYHYIEEKKTEKKLNDKEIEKIVNTLKNKIKKPLK